MKISQNRRWFIKSAASAPLVFGLAGCGSDSEVSSTNLQSSNIQASQVRTPAQISPLFLNDEEMATLTALTAQFVPTDDTAGAIEAQCARGIQFLLSAFSFSPAMIFAGGPFSNRGGSQINFFEQFIELDQYEELAWRLKIEGSLGLPEREFNGPVVGWQTIYRDGLAALNGAASTYSGGSRFEDLPGPAQSLLIQFGSDPAIDALTDLVQPHTLELMYGAPEYGGNADLVGWTFTNYDGDVQPAGYSSEQVTQPNNPGLSEMLGLFNGQNYGRTSSTSISQAALLPVPTLSESQLSLTLFHELIGMTSDEFGLALMLDGQSSKKRIERLLSDKINKPSRGQNG